MINGRVERCADNIMRRIVPARREGPTRTEPLERPSSGPRERNFARPRRRETCFYLHFPGTRCSLETEDFLLLDFP